MICTNCGSDNTSESVFCVKCGQKFSSSSQTINAVPTSENNQFKLIKILSIIAISISGLAVLILLILISQKPSLIVALIIVGFILYFSITVLLQSMKGINNNEPVNFKLLRGLSIACISLSGFCILITPGDLPPISIFYCFIFL